MTMDAVRAQLEKAVAAVSESPSGEHWVVRGRALAAGTPGRVSFERELAETVVGDVLSRAEQLLEQEFVPYDPSYQPSTGQVLVESLSELPELQPLHAALPSASADDAERGDVRATVHRASADAETAITAYRTRSAAVATKRTGVLLPRDGVYERVDRPLLMYDAAFDALVVGDTAFIAKTATFRTFGSTEKAAAMARTTFSTATAALRIDGADELLAAVSSDPNMVAKMAQLSRTLEAEPDYAEALTMPRLLAFLDGNPQIPIATTGDGDERRLVFESSPQKRWLIVKALADDFLKSELSNRSYEVGSKSPID
jgi:hypothetical protein